MISHFEHLVRKARTVGSRRAIVLWPHREASLRSAVLARERGLAQCTLIGDMSRVDVLVTDRGLDLADLKFVDAPGEEKAVRIALDLCRSGDADVLINDGVSLRVLLSAALDAATGLRTGSLLSGVSVFELEGFKRLFILADGLLVVSPDLERRVGIVRNAIHVAHRLGIELPRVALVAATEAVDPKSQVSVDAAQITMMARRKQIAGALIDGPLGFDNAISARAAQVKGIDSAVAGHVDVLIAPDLEAGNMLLHTLACLCRGRALHAIVGGRVPLILLSPDDDIPAHVSAFALGTLLA